MIYHDILVYSSKHINCQYILYTVTHYEICRYSKNIDSLMLLYMKSYNIIIVVMIISVIQLLWWYQFHTKYWYYDIKYQYCKYQYIANYHDITIYWYIAKIWYMNLWVGLTSNSSFMIILLTIQCTISIGNSNVCDNISKL